MEGIYRFSCEYGRSGTLSGIFIATAEQIEELLTKTIDLGECLGKHSQVYFEPGELKDHVQLVTTDTNTIVIFKNHHLWTGYDLTDYLTEED